jgi:hypothetical protein
MPADLIAAATGAVDVLETLEKAAAVLGRLRRALVKDPRRAAGELGEVLREIMRAPPAVNAAVTELLAVSRLRPLPIDRLSAFATGEVERQVEALRPHCHRILDVWRNSLSQWLPQSGASGADIDELERLLHALAYADDDLFCYFTQLAQAVQGLAFEAARRVASGREEAAATMLGHAALPLLEAQRKANALATALARLGTEFDREARG